MKSEMSPLKLFGVKVLVHTPIAEEFKTRAINKYMKHGVYLQSLMVKSKETSNIVIPNTRFTVPFIRILYGFEKPAGSTFKDMFIQKPNTGKFECESCGTPASSDEEYCKVCNQKNITRGGHTPNRKIKFTANPNLGFQEFRRTKPQGRSYSDYLEGLMLMEDARQIFSDPELGRNLTKVLNRAVELDVPRKAHRRV